ncbi:PREDICTED: target of EGR1 protein 1 [Nanorana parkeri]|uniref:target of EGR1 protein 1 n=1 Tax=Nanorana parkeri TaxID=125878 RepID=UPI00085495DB|nr:PREDICTED: target of EGR1 protein 1 [Nanorana parkeri]
MATLRVPVIDVYNDNFSELWPSILLALKTSTFIAVDTELSGLGSRKSLLNQCIEERYKAICQAARTRSVLSLGIACFKELPEKGESAYLSQIYNLTLLCMEDYTIEPQSVQFLVQHGFDFNKQYSGGIPYYKGNDKADERRQQTIRTLFLELLRARKPLVLHNGLIDLAFLYQSFYAQLPDKIMNFVADLSEMFPAGLYDTKYASEFETRFTASYLEYAYKKCKRENCRRMDSSTSHLSVEFCHYSATMSAYVDYRLCSLPDQEPVASAAEPAPVCERFSAYGWCADGAKCELSHNIDLIIDEDEKGREDKKKRKRRKRKKQAAAQEEETNEEVSMEPPCRKPFLDPPETPEREEEKGRVHMETKKEDLMEETGVRSSDQSEVKEAHAETLSSNQSGDHNGPPVVVVTDSSLSKTIGGGHHKKKPPSTSDAGTHRAGFDAFMTGYILAYVWMLKKGDRADAAAGCLPDCQNKIYLSGKNVPLQIVKSVFAKNSRAHLQKMKLIGAQDC